jgi:hypothetical protein
LDDNEKLHVFTDEQVIAPKPGWRVIGLIPNTVLGTTPKNNRSSNNNSQSQVLPG